MKHVSHHITRWMAVAGVAAFLAGPAALPAAAKEVPDEPMGAIPTVERVEVPIDDTGAEITQMGVAVALGAALAGGGAYALRRRARRGATVILRTPQRADAR